MASAEEDLARLGNTQRRTGLIGDRGIGNPAPTTLGNTAEAELARNTKIVPRASRASTGPGRSPTGPGGTGTDASGALTGSRQQQAFKEAGGAEALETGVNSREAIRQFDAAFNIRRGMRVDAANERSTQRLKTLAFDTPPTLDNIGAIKHARSTLKEQTKEEGLDRRAAAKAGVTDPLDPLKAENIESQIRSRDIDTGLKLGESAADQQERIQKQAEKAEEATVTANQRIEEKEIAAVEGDEGKTQAVRQAQLRREQFKQNFRGFDGRDFNQTFGADTPERALAESIPSIVGAIQQQLGETTLGAGGTETPPVDSLKSSLDLFKHGFSRSAMDVLRAGLTGAATGAGVGILTGNPLVALGGGIVGAGVGALVGSGGPADLNIPERGGGVVSADIEDLTSDPAVESALKQLLNPNDEIGRAIVVAVYGEKEAEEFYAQLGEDNPFAE